MPFKKICYSLTIVSYLCTIVLFALVLQTTLLNYFNYQVVDSNPFALGETIKTDVFTIENRHAIQLALTMDIDSDEFMHDNFSQNYIPKYEFKVEYAFFKDKSSTPFYERVIYLNGYYDNRDKNRFYLPETTAPDNGKIAVRFKVHPDRYHTATASNLQYHLYSDVIPLRTIISSNEALLASFISCVLISCLLSLCSFVIFILDSNTTSNTLDASSPSYKNDKYKMWAAACHAAALIFFVLPMAGFIIIMIIWLLKKNQSEFVNRQAIEAMNYRISMFFYYVISFILALLFVGLIIYPFLLILDVLLTLIATVRTAQGYPYRYPVTLRIIPE